MILGILLDIMRGNPATQSTPLDLTDAVIVCDGNSLTAGDFSTNPAVNSYPAVLETLSPFNTLGVNTINKGVGGQTTQMMINDAATDVDPLFDGDVASILVAWEIGNDIYFNGSAALAQSRFQSYCEARQAAGWIVVVVTLPARDHSVVNGGTTPAGDSDSVYNTKREECNDWLRENYLSFASAIVDLDADSRFATYNTTYFNADRVHFKDAGYALIAELVGGVLENLTE